MPTMHKKRIWALTVSLTIITVGFLAFSPNTKAAGISASDVLILVNKSRSENGLPALTRSKLLDKAAMEKANDMLKNNYFAHTSPKGVDPWHWFNDVGYDYKFAGENLAINYLDAADQHAAWMNSETHRKNILNINYQETGIAVVEGNIGGNNSILTVEIFGTTLAAATSAVNTESVAKGAMVQGADKPVEIAQLPKTVAESKDPPRASAPALAIQKNHPQEFKLWNISIMDPDYIRIAVIGGLFLSLGFMLLVFVSRIYGSLLQILRRRKAEAEEALGALAEYRHILKSIDIASAQSRHNHSIQIRGR